MNFLKKYWLVILLGLVSFFMFSYKLQTSVSFEGDLGRDLFEIAKISYGNFTLLGQKGSFGGIYTAPYHYYIFLLPFLISGRQLSGIVFFNALLFSLSISFFSLHVTKKFDKLTGFLSGLALSLMPFIIFSARNPGNGFTPVLFFLFFLTIVYFYDIAEFSWFKILLLGFLFGIILSMLFVYVTVLLPIFLLIFLLLKNKKMFILFLIGIFLAFSPLILFELKNNFVMLKNTFVDRSYLSFVNNTNIPNGTKLNKNIFLNAVDLGNRILPEIRINIYLIFLFLLGSLILFKKNKERLFIITSLLSYLFLTIMLRFQYSTHYLLPFLTLLIFTFFITVLNIKLSKLVFIIVIAICLINFSIKNYSVATRNYYLIKNRVEYVLSKKLINKNDEFNIILTRTDNNSTPAGNEYRFFFLINGFKTKSDFEYKDSPKLLLFSEDIKINLNSIKTWEMSEFDYSKVKRKQLMYPDPGMVVYLLEK